MKKLSIILLTTTLCATPYSMIAAADSQKQNNSNPATYQLPSALSSQEQENKDEKVSEVVFLNAWARPAAKGNNSAIFLNIHNKTQKNIFVSISAPDIADKVDFHQTLQDSNGVASMSKIDRFLIPANTEVVMQPRGLHIMLMGLKKQLVAGDSFELTFAMQDDSKSAMKDDITTKTITVTVGALESDNK